MLKPLLRLSLFILILGFGFSIGTLLEGTIPLTVVSEIRSIPSDSKLELVANTLLFARNYRLTIQVQDGEAINCVFILIGGIFQLEKISTFGFIEHGVLPLRGFYNLTIINPNIEQVTVRVSLDLYNQDQQQFLFGQIVFSIGFIFTLVLTVQNWRKEALQAN